MLPWLTLAIAAIPGGGDLRLKRRGNEFSIMLGSNELMNSRVSGSERALATLACDKLKGRNRPRVLIGGLGMGFTLRAALGVLPADAEVLVAELVPSVIDWARGPMADVFGDCLDDSRVTVVEGDVAALIAESAAALDAILLDVDNGPDGLTTGGNDTLYGASGLERAKAALKGNGILAIWSAHVDHHFARRLRQAGFGCEEKRVRAHDRGGAKHVIWLATKPG